MLTNKDFSIVRAALQYLDEEFSSDDDALLQHYLDDQGVLSGARVEHIKSTRAKFDKAEVYVALKHLGCDELVSSRLVKMPSKDEISYQVDRELPVTVFVAGN